MMGLLTQYAWAGPIIVAVIGFVGVVIGFLVGQYWQRAEYHLKDRTVTIQQVMAERELYERLQLLQQQLFDAIPKYIMLRDNRFSVSQAVTREQHATNRELSGAFEAEKSKLVSLVREYNQLEAKLSTMESRSPRFIKLPLPPMAPKNVRVESFENGVVKLAWDPPDRDPLRIELEEDMRELFQQYGQEYPSEEKGRDRADRA